MAGRRLALAITAVALVAGVLVALSRDETAPAAASSPAVLQRLAEAGSRLKLAQLPAFSPAALALQHHQVEAASIVVSKKQEITAATAANSSKVATAGAAPGAKKSAVKAKSKGADALGFLVCTPNPMCTVPALRAVRIHAHVLNLLPKLSFLISRILTPPQPCQIFLAQKHVEASSSTRTLITV